MLLQNFHESIYKYAQETVELCDEIGYGYQSAIIHDFRTTIKKLRALLRWQHKEKNIFKGQFGKLYHTAGKLRDIQVLLTILHKKRAPLSLIQWLKEQLDSAKKEWGKLYKRKTVRHFQKKVHHASINVSQHITFFQRKTEEMQWIIHMPAIDDIALHEVRKLLKDLQYVARWHQKNRIRIPELSSMRLKENGKKIGAYNDLRIGIELLDVYLAQEINAATIQEVADIKRKWQEQKEKQKISLMRSLSIFDKIGLTENANS